MIDIFVKYRSLSFIFVTFVEKHLTSKKSGNCVYFYCSSKLPCIKRRNRKLARKKSKWYQYKANFKHVLNIQSSLLIILKIPNEKSFFTYRCKNVELLKLLIETQFSIKFVLRLIFWANNGWNEISNKHHIHFKWLPQSNTPGFNQYHLCVSIFDTLDSV